MKETEIQAINKFIESLPDLYSADGIKHNLNCINVDNEERGTMRLDANDYTKFDLKEHLSRYVKGSSKTGERINLCDTGYFQEPVDNKVMHSARNNHQKNSCRFVLIYANLDFPENGGGVDYDFFERIEDLEARVNKLQNELNEDFTLLYSGEIIKHIDIKPIETVKKWKVIK